jgi:hypothetical protein
MPSLSFCRSPVPIKVLVAVTVLVVIVVVVVVVVVLVVARRWLRGCLGAACREETRKLSLPIPANRQQGLQQLALRLLLPLLLLAVAVVLPVRRHPMWPSSR